eukprot:3109722-Pyramimonas_sp.AAC.2
MENLDKNIIPTKKEVSRMRTLLSDVGSLFDPVIDEGKCAFGCGPTIFFLRKTLRRRAHRAYGRLKETSDTTDGQASASSSRFSLGSVHVFFPAEADQFPEDGEQSRLVLHHCFETTYALKDEERAEEQDEIGTQPIEDQAIPRLPTPHSTSSTLMLEMSATVQRERKQSLNSAVRKLCKLMIVFEGKLHLGGGG